MSAFLSGLESSGWLKHIKAVVETSVIIAMVGAAIYVQLAGVACLKVK